MRSNIEGAQLRGNLLMEGNRFGTARYVNPAEITLGLDHPHIVAVDTNAGVEAALPEKKNGVWFMIVNSAESGGAVTAMEEGVSTAVASVAAAGSALIVTDGYEWYAFPNPAGVSATNLTLTGNLSVGGNSALGNAGSDTIGLYGVTPVNQGTMTAAALTAIGTTTLSQVGTSGKWGFASSTAALALVTRCRQMQADLENLMARVDSVGLVAIAGVP